MEERIKKVMAAVLDVPLDEVIMNSSTETIKNWDSLKHINLVLALEEEFGLRFQDDEIPRLTSYARIKDAISRLKSGRELLRF